ncbi:MAG: biofilm regulation protein kinase SiaB [Synechococcaceae cyanobacterium ELA739]
MNMLTTSLSSLRDFFNGQRILICFNGPISRTLIGEIGVALKDHIESTQSSQSAAMDVFSVYIEMSQNIRHYANAKGYGDKDASATVVIAEVEDGHYAVSAGNIIELADGEALVARIEKLAHLDKAELKSLYKQQLRQPRDEDRATGAGLGLIEIARKSSQPLEANLGEADQGKAFFSLCAII